MKCELVGQYPALPGWIPASATTAGINSEAECLAAWTALKRLHQLRPFTGTFSLVSGSAKSICGQAVRVSKLMPAPVFKSDDDKEKTNEPKSLEDLAREREEEDKTNARRIQEAQDSAYAKAMSEERSEADCDQLAQIAVQKMFATIESEKKKASESASASSCHNSPLLASQSLQTLVLGSNVFSCKMDGYAFLPSWCMHALGVKDGQEISIEPLQLPHNKAGRAMRCSAGGVWHCKRKTEQGKCVPGKSICTDCEAASPPDLTCGLGVAYRVNWRMPNHEVSGELESLLGTQAHMGDFLEKHYLSYIKASHMIMLAFLTYAGFCTSPTRIETDRVTQMGMLWQAGWHEHSDSLARCRHIHQVEYTAAFCCVEDCSRL